MGSAQSCDSRTWLCKSCFCVMAERLWVVYLPHELNAVILNLSGLLLQRGNLSGYLSGEAINQVMYVRCIIQYKAADILTYNEYI